MECASIFFTNYFIQLLNIFRKKFADIPNVQIAVQPEECPTNGMALLKFSEWPFMLFDKIQPVAISK